MTNHYHRYSSNNNQPVTCRNSQSSWSVLRNVSDYASDRTAKSIITRQLTDFSSITTIVVTNVRPDKLTSLKVTNTNPMLDWRSDVVVNDVVHVVSFDYSYNITDLKTHVKGLVPVCQLSHHEIFQSCGVSEWVIIFKGICTHYVWMSGRNTQSITHFLVIILH